MMVFLRCVGEAVVARGMRGLMGLAPYGEQVYDVAAEAVERYRHARRERQLAADLQAVVQADMGQVRADAQRIARKVAVGRPETEVRQVEAYLTQVPGVARQSLRRPEDLSGTTVPTTMNLADPIQLAAVLPRHAPRFCIGDSMPHAPQWRFVELLGSGGFGEVWLVQHTFLDQRDRGDGRPCPLPGHFRCAIELHWSRPGVEGNVRALGRRPAQHLPPAGGVIGLPGAGD